MKALKVIGQLCKWTARVLAGLLLLAALAMALIQTPWAKRRLASLTARVLSTENVRVSIGRLQGLVPFDVRVDEIRLADASGDWLQAAGVQIQLSAADLARRRLVFQYVRVARLHLSRWPETAERPAAPPAAVRPAAHGPHIEFRRVQVNTLLLDKAVAGESLTLLVHGSADVSPAAGGRVQCQVLRLDDRIGSARVTASWNGSPATLTLDAELHDDPRGPLARRLPSPATGPLRAQLTGEGPMKAFRGRLEAGAEGFGQFSTTFTLDARRPLALDFKALFQNDGGLPLPFKEVALSGHADRLLDQPAGEFDAKVIYDDEPFAARMAVLYQDGRLQVSNLDFQAGSVSVKGNLTFDPESRLARGRLTAALPYLSEIANRWGWPVGGDARLDIELETAGDEQGVTIRGEGGNLTTPFAGAADFRLNARIQQAWHRPRGRVELVLHDVTAKQVAFSNLTFSVEGDKEALAWSVDAAGRALQPFDVSASGQFREADGERSMRIDKMTGRFAGRTCRLAAPAAVTVGRDRLAWGPITWQIGTGRLTTSGAFTGQDVQATMELNQLPLGVVSELGWPELEGHASGKLEIQGPCSRPAAELQLKFSGVKPRQPLVIPLTTAEADVRLRAQEGRLSAEWTLLGPARVSAAGEMDVPLDWSLRPLLWRFPSPLPLRGRLSAKAELAALLPPSFLENHVVRGALDAELELGGSLDAPDIDGQLTLQNGSYENLDLGIVLQDVTIGAQADLTSLVITNASATDGGRGRVGLEGRLEFKPSRQFPFALNLRLENAALVRQDHLSLDADGEVTLSGSLARSRLAGNVHIRQLEYQSVERPSATIPQLDVVEINRPGRKDASPGSTNGAVQPLELDLDVRAPARVMVRGRGLDSEWRGRLHIGGDLNQPVYLGSFTVLRGRFLFLGRRFTLDRATVSLDGRVPADPQLDISAEASAADVTARLTLAGSWEAPTWDLSSDPSLPADEIMAHLLFGRSADRLSALQAVRLAYGLNMLRGGGRAFDILGRGQSLLRVDQLDIKQDMENPELSSVAVGKYVGDRVFVQGEKSLSGQSDTIMVEVELSRSLRLQTETSPQIREGIRLNWSRDY